MISGWLTYLLHDVREVAEQRSGGGGARTLLCVQRHRRAHRQSHKYTKHSACTHTHTIRQQSITQTALNTLYQLSVMPLPAHWQSHKSVMMRKRIRATHRSSWCVSSGRRMCSSKTVMGFILSLYWWEIPHKAFLLVCYYYNKQICCHHSDLRNNYTPCVHLIQKTSVSSQHLFSTITYE